MAQHSLLGSVFMCAHKIRSSKLFGAVFYRLQLDPLVYLKSSVSLPIFLPVVLSIKKEIHYNLRLWL